MGGGKYMGTWGNLRGPVQRGIVTYVLSPYEQRALAGAAYNAIFNTTRRCLRQLPYVGTGLLVGYSIHSWALTQHEFLASKAGHAAAEGHH